MSFSKRWLINLVFIETLLNRDSWYFINRRYGGYEFFEKINVYYVIWYEQD